MQFLKRSKKMPKQATQESMIPAATALMTKEEAGLPGLPEELQNFTGFEGLDISSFVIPRIKLVQPTSKEGTAGMFRLNLTGDEFSSLSIIVVNQIRTRTFWNPDPKSEEVLCRSYDFLTPDISVAKEADDGSLVYPYSPICAKVLKNIYGKEKPFEVCEYAKWHGKDRKIKPECSEAYNFLCLQAEDLLPFWITFHGASIKPAESYLSTIALRREGEERKQSRLYHWQAELGAEMKTEPQKHYIAKFSSIKEILPENQSVIHRIMQDLDLMHAEIKRTFEAEETAGVAGDETPGGPAAPDAPNWLNGHEGA
jgi:hypothetical protein